MMTIILHLKRKSGLSREEFREYYESVHVPLGRKYLGHLFQDYKRHYVNSTIGVSDDGQSMVTVADSAYDAITCIVVKDQAALEEFWRIASSPEVGPVLSEDEARFLDRREMRIQICEEVKTWVAADLAG